MSSADILQVAKGLAAGGTITLVGINGNVVSVTDEGFLESIDTTARDILNHATYGLEQIYNAVGGGAGGIDVDLDTLLARLTSTRASYLDELDFDLDARLGTPAGASLAVDIAANQTDLNTLITNLTTVDTVVDTNQSELQHATYGLSALNTKMGGGATNSSYSYTAGTTEQDLVEFAKTNIYSVLSFWADLSNFTSGRVITARVYAKVDGTNYQKIDTMTYTVGTHDAISISAQLNLNHHWKITIQIDTTEAGAISVPYRYVLADLT